MQTSRSIFGRIVMPATTAFVLVVLSCSSDDAGPADPPDLAKTTVTAAGGGSVSSVDGTMTVDVPAGAIDHDVVVTVQPVAAPPAGALGKVYEIGPTGTQFTKPVTMTYHYDTAVVTAKPETLAVVTLNGTNWEAITVASNDAAGHVVSGTTTHFSPYGIKDVIVPPAPKCDATTCPTGCCAADGKCQPGTEKAVCGTGGAACKACDGANDCGSGGDCAPCGTGASECCAANRCAIENAGESGMVQLQCADDLCCWPKGTKNIGAPTCCSKQVDAQHNCL